MAKKKLKLIEIRDKRNYSQEYVANKLGMDTSCYCRRERGEISISNAEWEKLAQILGQSIQDIYEPDENQAVIFNTNTFGNNIGNNNVYSIPEFILENIQKHIQRLEEEIRELKTENQNLKEQQKK
jgi:DNA-binding XRE family transcriptional regulator